MSVLLREGPSSIKVLMNYIGQPRPFVQSLVPTPPNILMVNRHYKSVHIFVSGLRGISCQDATEFCWLTRIFPVNAREAYKICGR